MATFSFVRIASVSATRSPDVQLPDADVRTRFNERAFRNWTESSRRAVRVAVLVASDVAAGLLGMLLVQATWELVSAAAVVRFRTLSRCWRWCSACSRWRFARPAPTGGGKPRTDLVRLAAGIAIAAFLGWVQARLFGREVPALPNKAAYAVLRHRGYRDAAWVLPECIDWVVRRRDIAPGCCSARSLVVGSPIEAEESIASPVRASAAATSRSLDWVSARHEAPRRGDTRVGDQRSTDVPTSAMSTTSRGSSPAAVRTD